MDPNATLRRIGNTGHWRNPDCLQAIADLALWLDRGGFAPDWKACPLGARRFARATGKKVAL